MKKIIYLFLVTFVSFAFAEEQPEKLTPIQEYKQHNLLAHFICNKYFENANLESELDGTSVDQTKFRNCVDETKQKSKELFIKASKTVKKASAKKALKEYQIFFVTALDGIKPGEDEYKVNYKRRQQDLNDKLIESWNRFEIEQY
jgi:hypothetical protein